MAAEYQMAVSMSGHGSVVIGIAFSRLRPDFSERDRLMLDTLRPTSSRPTATLRRSGVSEKLCWKCKGNQLRPASSNWSNRLGALRLTSREAEVFGCLLKGRSNDEIAEDLIVTPWTVHKHLEHIYRKLGVQSRTAAIARVFDTLQTGR